MTTYKLKLYKKIIYLLLFFLIYLYLEKFPRIELKKFLSQIYTLKIKMTKIDLNVISKKVNTHLYS